ncbi:MAG: hypothetical protein LBK98_10080, partial [Peptococcaceae bacterium]|nr:hypothetical protein [Peptococcaceae bacterium]
MGDTIKGGAGRRRYRVLAGLFAALLGFSPFFAGGPGELGAAETSQAIPLYIDGQLLAGEDPAILTEGRTLVPLRVLMESLGAEVQWEGDYRTVTVTKNAGAAVRLWIDNRLVRYDEAGAVSYDVCDVAPKIIADRTYVPLRLVANAMGLYVEWDDANRRVLVDTSRGAEKKRFFDLWIEGVQAGQTVVDSAPLALVYGQGMGGMAPQGATQVKYLFLDPASGEGKIAARAVNADGRIMWLPDLTERRPGILAAMVCDAGGNFLAGAAVGLELALTPRVSLRGLTPGQVMTGGIEMGTDLNFLAQSVEYEFTVLSDGGVSRSTAADPMGTYTHNPPAGQTGAIAVRTIARDFEGGEYASPAVEIQAQVPPPDNTPKVTLKSFNADNVGKVPVTLSISRNFDAINTQYLARNVATGQTALLAEKPWGDYSWFPGPEMAGTWEIYVKVAAPGGKEYTSNSRTATVPSQAGIIINGAGPGQVITGEIKLHSTANAPVREVSYIISNPFNGSQRVLGTVADTAEVVSWTPEAVNEGERRLQAVAVLADGTTVSSELLTVKIYLGSFYSARPIVAKDQFITFVAPMALETQKQNGMSAALQVAQAILETGWGQSVPVDKYT